MSLAINIKAATAKNKSSWLHLRKQLWPHCEEEKHLAEMMTYLSSTERCVFIAFLPDKTAIGFCECALRHDYVEGSSGSPTAFLEGIFVTESFRKLGVANSLIGHVEKWAYRYGCHELGSDTEISNQASIDMHVRFGFAEKSRNVHFIKPVNKK